MFDNENFKNIEWNKLLKWIRLEQGLTQEELAKKLNLQRIQLLRYKQDKKPQIKIGKSIFNYIYKNNLDIKNFLALYSKNEYLNKNHLWGKLIDGIQTINGYSNGKTARLLNISKELIESWKVKKSIPRVKLRSKILKLVTNQDIKSLIKYSETNWKNYFYEIKGQLPVSNTMLAKLLDISVNSIKELKKNGKPRFKLRKKLINLKRLIGKTEDIRDVIFKKRKERFFKIKNNQVKTNPEIQQWNSRKNIHEIIGFRMLHKREKPYVIHICKLLNKQKFITFTNAILADRNLNIFNVDIYAFKILNQRKIRICLEVKNRSNRMSTSVIFQENITKLGTIKEIFNFDYIAFIAPYLTLERKYCFCRKVILLDNKDLSEIKNNYSFLDLIKSKKIQKITEINTINDLKQYLKQNKLTLRDASSATNISFSCISKWKKDKNIESYKKKINQLIYLVNTKGIAYIKFQRYKKIYTNKNFLKLKAIKKYLNMGEKEFKLCFKIKPSELVDNCLRNKCYLSKELLLKIKNHVKRNSYDWKDLMSYVKNYINKEMKKWKELEHYNEKVGWKFIKFFDNTHLKSKSFENRVSNFLSKKYRYNLKNVQIYLNQTNQLREIDLVSFNTNKDLLITECKLKIPRYGSKILLNDLDTIKNSIGAKHSWLVTQQTNLNKEFNKITKS